MLLGSNRQVDESKTLLSIIVKHHEITLNSEEEMMNGKVSFKYGVQ